MFPKWRTWAPRETRLCLGYEYMWLYLDSKYTLFAGQLRTYSRARGDHRDRNSRGEVRPLRRGRGHTALHRLEHNLAVLFRSVELCGSALQSRFLKSPQRERSQNSTRAYSQRGSLTCDIPRQADWVRCWSSCRASSRSRNSATNSRPQKNSERCRSTCSRCT